MEFSKLDLIEPLLRATHSLNYRTATPIQIEAIPIVLAGHDVIGCAQTGTGKTAAFTLPVLQRISLRVAPHGNTEQTKRQRCISHGKPGTRVLRALVLAPTRELASQIGVSLDRYGRFTPIQHTVVYGGVSQHQQVKALRTGVDVLVATPGRLLDLMQQGFIDLSQIELLVFDEADRMLDMGFLPDLKRIVASVPQERQTLMFSATMPAAIRRVARQWLKNPAEIAVGPIATPAERVTQTVHMVDKKLKADLLVHFLKETSRGRTLVFTRTKYGAEKLVKRLKTEGIQSASIHGGKSQRDRSRSLAQFKSNNPPVLVATDIAARGLDIDKVSHVVNFDLPEIPDTYVHRIGRTARAGATGVAVSFCSVDERVLLEQIEGLIQQTIAMEPTVDGFEGTETNSRSKQVTNDRRRGAGRFQHPNLKSKPRRRHAATK